MSLGVPLDHERVFLHIGTSGICFSYQDGGYTLISDEVSSSDEVCFAVSRSCSTFLHLQGSLAQQLESSDITSSDSEGYTQVILTTNVLSLLQLLSRGKCIKLLFDGNSRLRGWGKDFLAFRR